ncbi:MAG TPA: 16S rRNA (cytidine(1402)-2'-O)-methyltransferase [Hyphomicrobiaceae bacterium]|nr:16S rRNA (cytidine(1402)-2'-O)-methyltransferase [Hyphomicrobiaceae bacterium]
MTQSGDPLTSSGSRLPERAAELLRDLLAEALPPGLHVVATPIGNLGDISLRALSTLAGADLLYCEDTRHSRVLLTHFGITRPLRAYHEHNAERERPRILAELTAGRSVALISDAGTPLISDPGYKLVRAALAAGIRVSSLPGASAVLAALTAAGLATDTFLFVGFLPAKAGARRGRLTELRAMPATLVLFEAPSRLAETLLDIAMVLGDRHVAVARELTKLHEEVRTGAAAELAQWAAAAVPRGEMVIVIGQAPIAEVGDATIAAHLQSLPASMSVRDAAKATAEALSVPKTRAYELALALKKSGTG